MSFLFSIFSLAKSKDESARYRRERQQQADRHDDAVKMEQWSHQSGRLAAWQMFKRNEPQGKKISGRGGDGHIENMTDEEWEQLGRDITNNTHVEQLYLYFGALNDHKMSLLFRGLTSSSSIKYLDLHGNELSAAGIRRMVPFLQDANNLRNLHLDHNNLQSEGFNILLRALRSSPIEYLNCTACGIESIEVDGEHIPTHLENLNLNDNNIDVEGCRRLAELLQRRDASLTELYLSHNEVDNEGVEILADALQSNTSLTTLHLRYNEIHDDGIAALAVTLQSNFTLTSLRLGNNKIGDDGVTALANALRSNTSLTGLDLRGNDSISERGKISLLKLVNDVSSIESTLQSNNTLETLHVSNEDEDEIQQLIDDAVYRNSFPGTGGAGREKVIFSQLHCVNRAQLADLQGVKHSVYSEIDTLYLPEVLSLINRRLCPEVFFPTLKSSMIGLLSRVDMKLCIQKQVARHETSIRAHEARIRAMISEHESMISEHGAKIEELNARLATMEDSDQKMNQEIQQQHVKKRRVDVRT